jgi:flavin reductase (DIM6/NTAB) family NADH-FMN oxidoreductase RutF
MDLCSDFAKSAYGPAEAPWECSDKGCPYINGSSARFMCSNYSTYDGGDHTIIVGEVSDFIHNGEVPLVFSSGRYLRGI